MLAILATVIVLIALIAVVLAFMVYNNLIRLRTKSKDGIVGRDMLLTFVSFGIGVALLVLGLLYFKII